MLKKLLETKVGQTFSNSEFEAVMEMTTEDIKFNNVSFNKKTNRNDMLTIAVRCATALKRCS